MRVMLDSLNNIVLQESGDKGNNRQNLRLNSNYLEKCQVDTPIDIVKGLWHLLTSTYRPNFNKVLDMGSGDGRFAHFGTYKKYIGYEVDPRRFKDSQVPSNANIINSCVFHSKENKFDLCIGNPPYVRHHDIADCWRDSISSIIENAIGVRINKQSNAFLYFVGLSLIKTNNKGLVALVVPYEWVNRPSSKTLRKYIKDRGWSTHIYRFNSSIFKRVLTTASITIIDKSKCNGSWKYFNIDRNFKYTKQKLISGTKYKVLNYEKRGQSYYALRGMSPGTQKVFTLTEGERVHHGLKIGLDVSPCVTSLRHIKVDEEILNEANFNKYFVEKGMKCWLIRSDRKPSTKLLGYLKGIPEKLRKTSTCINRKIWWKFRLHPVPRILYSSAFMKHGPKFLNNKINANAIGSVQGIHGNGRIPTKEIIRKLGLINFESRIIHHAKSLKKVEVGQMNYVLNSISSES